MINPTAAAMPSLPSVDILSPKESTHVTSGADGFRRVIDELIGTSVRDDAKADGAVLDVALGRSDDVPGAALAVGMSDLSFRRVLEVRNKLLDAYQEVMRMQV
jgi:flagellar hook-basal body complex protein FliE